jgi:hypothetical protein
MYLYHKTLAPKNTFGKLMSLFYLIGGAILYLSANTVKYAASVLQVICVLFIGISIYIAVAFLLRQYCFSIMQSNTEDTDLPPSHRYDFIITEKKGKRDIKVLHFGMRDLTSIQIVDEKNKTQVAKERKPMKRYTYNMEYAAKRLIEVRAVLDEEEYSILITYDEELLKIMQSLIK